MLLSRGRLFAFLSQGVEIVSVFVEDALADEFFDDIEHSRPRVRIVSTGLEQLVQIERFFSPVREAPQNFPG